MICAVVPALNEAPRIGKVVRTLPASVSRIVVVDDGCTDDTAAVARAADPRVVVVRHDRTRGVGAAVARGCAHARSLGAEIVVVVGGDGQMDPADLAALVAPVARGEADFAKGNRLAWPGGALEFPWQRLVGVVAFAAATRIATGVPVHDAQCSYVALGPRALAEVDWPRLWPRFGYPNDLLAMIARRGLRVVQVPVRPIYADEQSKLRPWHLPGIAFVIARAGVRRLAEREARL